MLRRTDRRGAIPSLARVAFMPAAALAVHQLRYWLAFGSNTSSELARQGHSYLHSVVPWIVLLIAISVGVFLRAVGRALGGRCSLLRYTLSFTALWLLCAACLVGIYVCQEFLEGLFATGHPGGLAGIFGYGGWWSVPAALAVGLVLAAIFHGARLGASRAGSATRPRRGGETAPSRGPAAARCAPAADGAACGRLVGPRPASLSGCQSICCSRGRRPRRRRSGVWLTRARPRLGARLCSGAP